MNAFLEPWEAPADDAQRQHFEDELQSELAEGHVLFGKQVTTLAHRVDRDDVLFAVDSGPRVAVVHLTYSAESSPRYPLTKIYDSLEDFAARRMQPDHEEYESS